MAEAEFCEHDSFPDTCSACRGPASTKPGGSGRAGGSPTVLDTPEALERYRERYQPDREDTFEAYVEVFFRLSAARDFPGGWTMFSRCANAEPALVRTEADLVARAADLMRAAGYVHDDSGRPRRGRTWRKTGKG